MNIAIGAVLFFCAHVVIDMGYGFPAFTWETALGRVIGAVLLALGTMMILSEVG